MEFKFIQIKGHVLIKGEIIAKMGWGHLKILRTTEPEKLTSPYRLVTKKFFVICH
jgi:hypothetical protein